MKLQIVYHGTNGIGARRILKKGFKVGTHFGTHLEDALGYGGSYIFEVAYPSVPKLPWQFRIEKRLRADSIVRLIKYNPAKIKYDNMVLRHKVCISNSTKGEIEDARQHIERNPSLYSEAELIAYGAHRFKDGLG